MLVNVQDSLPTCNHPDDIITTTKGIETIDWILSDDFGPGEYRVMANDTLGNWYIVINWIAWTPDTSLNVPINRTAIGTFEYMIQYTDSGDNVGGQDFVLVKVILAEETDDDDDSSGDDNTSTSEPSAIPGYNMFFIETLFIIIPILLLKKLKKTKSLP